MEYKIRKALEGDYTGVFDLVLGLARFQGCEEAVTNSVAGMLEDRELYECYVAVDGEGNVVGFALFFMTYSTWVGKQLYLEDLYVVEAHRKQGLGTRLVQEVFKYAQAEDCQRVRWQVSDWNDNAIGLYTKLGASVDRHKYNCDFDRAAIEGFPV